MPNAPTFQRSFTTVPANMYVVSELDEAHRPQRDIRSGIQLLEETTAERIVQFIHLHAWLLIVFKFFTRKEVRTNLLFDQLQ
jgi:hypothetical protein